MRNGNSHPHNGNGATHRSAAKKDVVITGGAGFIGANLAHRLLTDGERVVLYDNLSRDGVERNYEWLRERHGDQVRLHEGEISDLDGVTQVIREASAVYHFAAQVAVTTSVVNPRQDFEVNAVGTLNVLEALRSLSAPPPLVYTSTNKVYGSLRDVKLRETETRYEPADPKLRASGIDESRCLDFYSPYGCSKGTADQYVLDHARIYGLPAVVFRMSCIYGPHQFGTEDQGWVAHFLIQALEGRRISLYGDGKQVRDILYVGDLVEALLLARRHAPDLAGNAFNIGGGPGNTTSLLELLSRLPGGKNSRMSIEWGDWRPGDQRYYVSNTAKFKAATGWTAKVGVDEGIRRLHAWLEEAREARELAAANA